MAGDHSSGDPGAGFGGCFKLCGYFTRVEKKTDED